MKKVTKTATATTPATPASAPVKKAAAKPVKTAPVKQNAASPTAVAPAAPAVKAEKPVSVATMIVAQIDIGFGNALYIRGDGPGLSWEAGVPLDCVADDKWSVSLQGAARPVVFKLLVNDLTWSSGEDYIVQPGSSVVITPAF